MKEQFKALATAAAETYSYLKSKGVVSAGINTLYNYTFSVSDHNAEKQESLNKLCDIEVKGEDLGRYLDGIRALMTHPHVNEGKDFKALAEILNYCADYYTHLHGKEIQPVSFKSMEEKIEASLKKFSYALPDDKLSKAATGFLSASEELFQHKAIKLRAVYTKACEDFSASATGKKIKELKEQVAQLTGNNRKFISSAMFSDGTNVANGSGMGVVTAKNQPK